MRRRDALKISGTVLAAGLIGPSSRASAEQSSNAFSGVANYLNTADAVADRLGYTDPELRPAYHKHVMMLLSLAYVEVFGTDISSPDWVPHIPFYHPWGSPNPDDIYHFTPIDPKGSYRFTGTKGTAPVAVVTMRTGGAHLGEINKRTLSEIDLNAVEADDNGQFSFIVSPKKPKQGSESWYALHPETTSLLMRSRTTNETQKNAVCKIERIDRAPGSAFPDAKEVNHKMEMLTRYASNQNEFLLGYLNGVRDRGGDKGFIFDDQSGYGALVRQKYLMHVFDIASDEALILDSEVPERVHYWSVQLYNPFFDSVDYISHQSSFNGEQIRLSSDGHVRFVVAPKDPGVPNWLDTGGWLKGGMLWRWNNASSYPLPKVSKVKFKEIRSHLPSDTPRVSPKERREALSEHMAYYKTRGRG